MEKRVRTSRCVLRLSERAANDVLHKATQSLASVTVRPLPDYHIVRSSSSSAITSTHRPTLLLLRAGYKYVPYSSLESVIEQSKDAYYPSLRQTQATLRKERPDWQPWLTFFLRALQQQKSAA